jgi:hypothetical protein
MTWEYWRDMRKLKPSEYQFFGVGRQAAVGSRG